MRLHRFYIKENIEKGKDVRIEDSELLHQWSKVFRLSAGDRAIVFNGNGKEFEGYFKVIARKEAVLAIDKENQREPTNIKHLEIFQSIIKKDNFELIVEKCTEIGVSAFHPIISERSEKKDLNIEILRKIAKEASEQSGKVYLPEIFEPIKLEKAMDDFNGELFVLDFDAENFSKTFEKFSAPKIGILIGPEGGWTDKERELFKLKNIKSFSLGSQVLRAETAAIVASAVVLIK